MAPVEKLWDPMRLIALLISVTLTKGFTITAPGTNVSPVNTAADTNITSSLVSMSPSVNTSVPQVLWNSTSFVSNAFSASTFDTLPSPVNTSTDIAAYVNISGISTSVDNNLSLQGDISIATFNTNELSTPVNSTSLGTNITASNPPFGPDHSNTNIKPDPLGRLTTQTVTTMPGSSTTTTQRPALQSSSIVDRNPYANDRNLLPRPIDPLTTQQQRLLYPWLFPRSNNSPYAQVNSPVNSLAPLYLTALDADFWPLLFSQQRSELQQQQQPRSQQVLRQNTPNQNQPTQGQNSQLHLNRNNLASWFFLSELY